MTGHRSCIDSPEIRRKLSREALESRFFVNYWFLKKSLKDRIPPKWSLVVYGASQKGIQNYPNSENEKWKPDNLEMCRNAHRKLVEIGLVEILSTWMACHLVTKRVRWYPWIIHGYPWIIHGLSMHYPWIIHGWTMDKPWVIHGWSMDSPWIVYGLSMDNPWITHGLSMDYHGLSRDVHG